jgi:predicted acyltransferase
MPSHMHNSWSLVFPSFAKFQGCQVLFHNSWSCSYISNSKKTKLCLCPFTSWKLFKRNKIMFMFFHLLETYIMNPSLFFNSFFTLPPRGKHRWQPRSAMRVGR